MASSFKTPGVYIEEISKLPASIAPVATAIPAFIGYTEKREKDGETLAVNTPVRITSLLEYETIFGGPFMEDFTVTLSGPDFTEAETIIAVAPTTSLSEYTLYYNLQMFFANGGGPCYIVSVGLYGDIISEGDDDEGLLGGLKAVEEEDEVTLLVIPEAITLDVPKRKVVNDAMLVQCNKLQDRFAIMDVYNDPAKTVFQNGNDFRGDDIGSDDLKYGTAYYPPLVAAIDIAYDLTEVKINDDRGGTGSGTGPFHDETLYEILEGDRVGDPATGIITVIDETLLEGDYLYVDSDSLEITAGMIGASPVSTAGNIANALSALGNPNYTVVRKAGDAFITITATQEGSIGNTIVFDYDSGATGVGITLTGSGTLTGGNDSRIDPDKTLYNNIVTEILKNKVILYPSSTMAGIYARVDNDRGVWKAPANVGVRLAAAPKVLVTAEEQENLNVDANTGKSINAIRTFAGKGIIVWGARTLAGNDNEWRYVPVRRLFIFVEESVKKATEFVVFEPNDANTWLRVKTMIENFLTGLWKDGALAGATPGEAFFVKVGLGLTMTPQDILEGRMNVEIGMAAVRPAEFIILKFSHKLQTS